MAETRAVFDVTAKNFQADVVERSRQVPVVVLFWADQLPPAKDARRVLETLAAQYQGKFALALVRRVARSVAGAVICACRGCRASASFRTVSWSIRWKGRRANARCARCSID